ncbi:MAG: transglutaminase-like domain-containing protein, partial [Rudaea sp.]
MRKWLEERYVGTLAGNSPTKQSGQRWQRIKSRCALTFGTALIVALAASNLLMLPTPAYAAAATSAHTHAGTSHRAPASTYSTDTLRPRFFVPQGGGHQPHLSAADYQNATYLPAATNLVAAGSSGTLPPPTAADLAQTDDVVLTPAIRDLATSLGNNPVSIYNWVRDHIRFTPTYGSIQGADATLQTHQGNAFDTSSLLIALLRASNIPARYAYGTIELPASAAQNWVGGVSVPAAAVSLFDQGGIPVDGVLSGGSIASIQIEHVWVDAYVDFKPSRGAKNRNASTWVPLDAAYKQYRYTAGMDVRGGVNVDTSALAAQITQGATQTADGVSGLDTSGLAAAFADFSTRVGGFITAHKANATVSDVLGSQATIVEDLPLLAGTLPYKTVAIGAVYADLPDTLRWKVQYGVYASDYDRSQANALVSVTQSLPQLIGKRLTLSFAGASASDNDKVASLLNSNPLPSTLAGAAVQTTAQITLDGQVVSSGGSVPLGTTLVGGLGVFDPKIGNWTFTPDARVVAGETHSLAAIGASVAPTTLAASRDRLATMASALGNHQY